MLGLAVKLKSRTPVTVIPTVAVCVADGDVPVRVTRQIPVTVAVEVTTFRLTECPAVTEVLLSVRVIPVQVPLVLVATFTVSATPPVGTDVATVTSLLVATPCVMVRVVGYGEIPKSCSPFTVTVTVAVCVADGDVPVKVKIQVPAVVAVVVETVKTTEPPAVTDDELKAMLRPVQVPLCDTLSVTASATPPLGKVVRTFAVLLEATP